MRDEDPNFFASLPEFIIFFLIGYANIFEVFTVWLFSCAFS